ncbi:hypothetical protein F5Y08DRAFT_342480 [Xylaria arbuscula]|nr:hypothetical protein F5Y08DRAFT_342480 [Xylaria arbuscula]
MPQTLIPTLHHLSHSQSFRCLWVLEELKQAHGIEYNLKCYGRQMGQAPPGLKKVFPLGNAPVLTLETTNDEPAPTVQIFPGVLTEAHLILRFLSDKYGQGLWDVADVDKNRDGFFQEFAVNSLASRIGHLVVMETPILLLPFGLSSLVTLMLYPVLSVPRNAVQNMFQLLEDALSPEKPFFSGSKLGLADVNMSWGVDVASQRGYFNSSKFPKLQSWHEAIQARPAYCRALDLGNGYDLRRFGADKHEKISVDKLYGLGWV